MRATRLAIHPDAIVLVSILLLAACGGPRRATEAPTVLPTPTATIVPAETPSPSGPTPTPSQSPTAIPTPGGYVSALGPDATEQLKRGELLFQKTAAGFGCQGCHGRDAGGGTLGPDIQGKSASDISKALGSVVPMQLVAVMSTEDIDAVAAYLKYLASRP